MSVDMPSVAVEIVEKREMKETARGQIVTEMSFPEGVNMAHRLGLQHSTSTRQLNDTLTIGNHTSCKVSND
jgi:hypothetical protein